MRTLAWSFSLVFGFLAAFSASANASVLDIQFTGVDLILDGGNLTDATQANNVGQGIPSQADPLVSMSFLKDGVLAGPVITTNIATDIFATGISGIPATGGMVTSSGNGNAFGCDLLTTTDPISAWGLALQIDKVTVGYTGSNIGVWVVGQATHVFDQQLPYGLVIDEKQPVYFTFSSVLIKDIQVDAGYVTHFSVSGTGSIKASLVPEPANTALLALGTVLSLLHRRRPRR